MAATIVNEATGTILRLREGTGTCAKLRRGHSPATEHYAYPYLAPLWTEHGPHFRVPLLRLAALAATVRAVPHRPDVKLGTFLNQATLGTGPRQSPEARERTLELAGRRLVWIQTGDVNKLHTALRNLLTRRDLPPGGLSWTDVAATYLWWDQPNADQRRTHRARLLEQFYSA